MLRSAIQKQMGIPSVEQRLILRGRLLNDDTQTIQCCGLKDQDVLHVIRQVSRSGEASTSTSTQLNQQQIPGATTGFHVAFVMRIPTIAQGQTEEQQGGSEGQQREAPQQTGGNKQQREGNGQQQREGTIHQPQQGAVAFQGTVETTDETVSEVMTAMIIGTILRSMGGKSFI